MRGKTCRAPCALGRKPAQQMKKGYIYIAITTLLFSTMEIVLKTISGIYNPVQLTFTRFFIGGLVLLPLALRTLKKRGLAPSGRDILKFALIGFLGVTVSMTIYQLAVQYTEASVVAVLFSSNPLFVLFFAYMILGEPIYKRNIAALLFDVAGILFVINIFHMELSGLGTSLAIISTLVFALYGVSGKKESGKFGGVVTTCFGFLLGSAEMMILAGLTHIPAVSDMLVGAGLSVFADVPFLSGFSLATLPQIIYVSVGVTGIGFTCYFMAMEKTSANTTSLVFFFKPILAPILAFLVLGEEITTSMIIGIALILVGSLTNILPALIKKKAPEPEM